MWTGQAFDYVLCYARDPDTQFFGLPFQGEDAKGKYTHLHLRTNGSADLRADRPSMFYPLTAPDGKQVLPIGPGGYESRWRIGPDEYQESLESELILWKQVSRDGVAGWQPYLKYYLEGRTARPSRFWDDIDGNKTAAIEVKSLLGDKIFRDQKPTALPRRLIQAVFGDERQEGLILDFFAGSGTTGHAVMAQNAINNSNYRYVLVQVPETLDSENNEQKNACKVCEILKRPHDIVEITKERLRRVGVKVRDEKPLFEGDLGFRVYKLASTNICEWEPVVADSIHAQQTHAEHIVEGRNEADVITELLLKLGLDLCVPIEHKQIAGKTVHSVGAGSLIACLSDGITREVAEELGTGISAWVTSLAPDFETRVVFKDSGFADIYAKRNIATILTHAGITNILTL